jgi:hypothetical protein
LEVSQYNELLFKNSFGDENTTTVYRSSIEALREILRLDNKAHIIRVTPGNSKLSNGLEYCCVEIKSSHESTYCLQAYGEEAIELHKEASMTVEIPVILGE